MSSLAGKVAFSITWAQLAALRDLPEELLRRGHIAPYSAAARLIGKGLARVSASGLYIGPTRSGIDLLAALDCLVPPRGHSRAS